MNSQKFLELLPQVFLFSDDKSNKKEEISPSDSQNDNFSNLLKLIDLSLNCLEEDEIYCEINSDSKNNLLSTLLKHDETQAYWVHNESEENINTYLGELNLEEKVCVYEGDADSFFRELRDLETEDKIGICYFNQFKDYRSLLLSLMSSRFFLADEAFIIISNVDQIEVKQAISDFKSFHSSQQVHQLLTATKENSTDLNLEQEIIILLWQNNTGNLIAKRINQQGQSKLIQATREEKKLLLHVGCGRYREDALPEDFRSEEWVEIRLDIDPRVQPDIIGTITDLSGVPDNTVDAVYSSHNLEHIYNFEVPIALAEFKRVLKDGGFVMFVVPDMQTAAEWVMRGEMEDSPLYQSPAGPVPALWMFYGMGTSYPGIPYMAHKTGFTTQNLGKQLEENGFKDLKLIRRSFDIIAYGYK